MSYVKDSLLDYEHVELEIRSHGSCYFFVAVLSILASISVSLCWTESLLPGAVVGFRWHATALFFLVWSTYSFWNLYLMEMLITNLRIVFKTGLISQNIREISLYHIDSIEVKQSIWGKMFNYGTVLFIGYGVVKNVMFGADVHLKEIRRLRVKFKRVSYPASVKRQVEILMSMLPRDGKQFF